MMDKLREVALDGEAPAPVPPPGPPPLREDEPHPGLDTAAALQNAPAQARDQFSVPRVIDAE
jgi:Asp-tRNA(Asn)/Glu-tRNA(Gln) amidotransferase C subunit